MSAGHPGCTKARALLSQQSGRWNACSCKLEHSMQYGAPWDTGFICSMGMQSCCSGFLLGSLCYRVVASQFSECATGGMSLAPRKRQSKSSSRGGKRVQSRKRFARVSLWDDEYSVAHDTSGEATLNPSIAMGGTTGASGRGLSHPVPVTGGAVIEVGNDAAVDVAADPSVGRGAFREYYARQRLLASSD
eukprot:6182250-Pleurochrysis_carterae.AAC.2